MSDHYFHNLRQQGEKLYKFQQRKSAPEGSEGECLAVALMWIKEKITASRFRFSDRGEFRVAAGGDIHGHNFDLMQRARSYGGHGTIDQLRTVERGVGVQRSEEVERIGRYQPSGDVYDLRENMERVARRLQPGTGAVLRITLRYWKDGQSKEAGHAVAFYLSRGLHLYFFDSNCGIYKVTRPGSFVREWIAGCEARGWSALAPMVPRFPVDTAWCTIYGRG